tara:strand:- start:42 stop:983 length:942 start_codon:yes stop_codon:yes gene_type:complete
MKVTNQKGFPEALVKAVENDSYSKGNADRSVTGLLSPPRQAALADLHEAELSEDVSDRTYALYGQLIHLLLERAGEQSRNAITEERLFTEVGGWTISGQTDSLTLTDDQKSWIISDYKFVTAYKFKRDRFGNLPEQKGYEEQLNLYAYLLEANGFPVDALKIVGIYRDWSKLEAKRDSNYPQLGAETHDIPLWSHDRVKAFIEERVQLHQHAKNELPECTEDDRWSRKTKYALMVSKTSKRARKLFFSYYEAVEFAENSNMKSGWVIERRLGEDIRCENYCLVSDFCEQFKTNQARAKNWLMSEWMTETDNVV